jgi:hypothetical protein
LFTVEVRECGVSSAKGSDIFVDVWCVARVFIIDQVAEERMKLKAGFGDGFCSGNDLFGVIAQGKCGNARFGETVLGDVRRIDVHVKFEGCSFHVIGFFKTIAGVGIVFTILGCEFGLDVGVSVSSLEAAEVGVRVFGRGVESGLAEFGI